MVKLNNAIIKHLHHDIGQVDKPASTPQQARHRERLRDSLQIAGDLYPDGLAAYIALNQYNEDGASAATGTPATTLYRHRRKYLYRVALSIGYINFDQEGGDYE